MCWLILGTALLGKLAVAVRAVQDRLRLGVRRLTFGTALRDQLAVAVRAVQGRLRLDLNALNAVIRGFLEASSLGKLLSLPTNYWCASSAGT